MKKMRLCVLATLLLSLVMPSAIKAQDKVEASVGADVMSKYIWRGLDMSGASIQPYASLDYKGFSLGGWGSFSIDGEDYKEFDLSLSYSVGGFTFMFTDYWTDYGTGYFKYKSRNTDHVFNLQAGYDFDIFSINWDTNLTGDDYKANGKRAYSSYLEVSVPFSLLTIDWAASAGITPWENEFYGADGFSVICVGLGACREFSIGERLTIPVTLQGMWNPEHKKAYFAAGVGIYL